jgi:hypothetical protein
MKSLFGLAIAVLGLLSACGGDVKVDGDPGASRRGGQGGDGAAGTSSSTSSSTSTASTNPSTSTGSMPSNTTSGPPQTCDCLGSCQKLMDCGFGDIPCDEFCQNIPQDIWQCVCNTGDCNVDFCFGGTGGSSTGGAGGAPSEQCFQCVSDEALTTCNQQWNACLSDDQCNELVLCHDDCGWTIDCNESCDSMFPGGFGEFHALIECATCGVCMQACSNTSLGQYCALGGG